ncbi:phenoloxidase-activating factor 2-like [Penaeus monodon]|uniref:Masquerade-like serine proteinase-like protein 2 n=1 Tax=Penaeus monodon TaxID=6687 RepID=C3UPD5_PENMO|nr:phenoloxidase-activating factor 2-like [Penaeus monodon]ACP19560.1 masquerade-like serine proteinase-like protein 2 [Penaeus monodon]
MMRAWACALAVAVVAALVGGQNNQNVRLGLVATQLGVQPVPGSQTGQQTGNQIAGPQGCICLPVNQRCPYDGSSGSTSGAGVFDVRIVNRPGAGGECGIPGQKICCPPGVRPARPVRPPPVAPQPVPIQRSGCGGQNPIPYRQAQYAEATFGEYPWMVVVLDFGDGYKGGGVLVAPDWVLTAAHKVYNERSLKVRLGEHNVRQRQDHPNYAHLEVPIDRIIIHPNFDNQALLNDVALLHLAQPVNVNQYPHIGTACLPSPGQIFNGQTCWVTGWGKDAFETNGNFQEILKEVDVPIVDSFRCQASLQQTRLGLSFLLNQQSFICAGGIAGKDACTGDGGSPLVCPTQNGWTVVGLVAWGIGCAQGNVPGVYVNIPNMMDFIRQFVRF